MNYRPGFTVLAFVALGVCPAAAGEGFRRGDMNNDGSLDITDPIFLLSYIFAGQAAPVCAPIANANADSRVDISDAIYTLAFLFSSEGQPIPPLTAKEIEECENSVPPPVTVLRHGTFQDFSDPPHNIVGSRVEELSDKTIRLTRFNYDGTGLPQVVIRLTRGFPAQGPYFVISGDLLREEPYVGETFSLPIPRALQSEQYDHVEVWCDFFPLTYAFARLRAGPFP